MRDGKRDYAKELTPDGGFNGKFSQTLIAKSSVMWIKFHSDVSNVYTGFKILYTATGTSHPQQPDWQTQCDVTSKCDSWRDIKSRCDVIWWHCLISRRGAPQNGLSPGQPIRGRHLKLRFWSYVGFGCVLTSSHDFIFPSRSTVHTSPQPYPDGRLGGFAKSRGR